MKKLAFLFLLISHSAFTQSTILDQTINQIDFKQDTIKAVFDWVTDNIRYDVKKLNTISEGSINSKDGKFKTESDYKDDLLKKALQYKNGVCQDYSLIFDAIVKKLNYDSFIIEGITKDLDGKLNRKIGHTWNAVKVNGEWRLFDPTWGAGYVIDDKKFLKEYNEQWYDVSPKVMFKTHMPFDPIWQLSSQPVDYNTFIKNDDRNIIDQNFDFETLIDQFLKNNHIAQKQSQLQRSEKMKVDLRLIELWQRNLKNQIKYSEVLNVEEEIEKLHKLSQDAVDQFNDYIKAKNNRFKGSKYSPQNAKSLLNKSKANVGKAIAGYKNIQVEDNTAKNFINKSIRLCESLSRKIDSELRYMERLK